MKSALRGALGFIQHEAAASIFLLFAAVAALLIANSPARWLYDALLGTPVTVGIGKLLLSKPLLLWINDGLMAVFFFLVGLEIKRELLVGELSSVQKATVPAVAALGGMLVPALIYVSIASGDATALKGWAIPAATDIAFAVGVLAALGPRIPASLKIFLLALAIIDDLGAIVVIALFYTTDLSTNALLLAGLGILVLVGLNRFNVTSIAPYVLVGIFIWVCVLKSGVHATLAGVATALAIPLHGAGTGEAAAGPIERLESSLHPWVTYGILPLFAFANAGVSLTGLTFDAVVGTIPLGIAAGLFLGKPIGIVAFTWMAVKSGMGERPEGTSWRMVLGVGCLGGIGFTMSLFIGSLAFTDPAQAVDVRIGVLAGSILSALAGYFILRNSVGREL